MTLTREEAERRNRECNKRYYEKNKERIAARSKAYQKSEKYKTYEKSPGRKMIAKKSSKLWRKRHPEEHRKHVYIQKLKTFGLNYQEYLDMLQKQKSASSSN